MQKYGFLATLVLCAGLNSPLTHANACNTRVQQLEQQAAQPSADMANIQQQVEQALLSCDRSVGLYVLQANLHSRAAQWPQAIHYYKTALKYHLVLDVANVTTEVQLRLALIASAMQIPDRPSASDQLRELRRLQSTGRLSAAYIAQIQQFDLAVSNDLNTRPLQAQELSRAASTRDLVIEPVQLNYRIPFGFNQHRLDTEAQQTLLGMLEALRVGNIKKVTVIGHTDQRGESSYNQRLSEQRAQAVVNFLVKEAPDLTAKLRAEGRGMSKPLSIGSTENDHAQNRRVEFLFGH